MKTCVSTRPCAWAPDNKCTCVWQGTAPKALFKKFKFETLRTEAAARKFLADINLAHFFDAAAACVAIEGSFLDDDDY